MEKGDIALESSALQSKILSAFDFVGLDPLDMREIFSKKPTYFWVIYLGVGHIRYTLWSTVRSNRRTSQDEAPSYSVLFSYAIFRR